MAKLFVNALTVMDVSLLDRDRGVVGESWIVDIELTGELNEQGMVFDFGHVKKHIKHFIDEHADHRLMVPTQSSGCSVRKQSGTTWVEFPLKSGGVISHQSPNQAVLLMPSETIEAEPLAKLLAEQLKAELPDNVHDVSITLRNEHIDSAYYHYTHGLQKHLGQCQRIAHGHRSKIEVYINDQRRTEIEEQWAKRLACSYIASKHHIAETSLINSIEHTRMAYTAEEGDFAITLPSEHLFIMSNVTTVENIADCLAQNIGAEHHGHVLVKAYEGVGKGAFGEKVGTN